MFESVLFPAPFSPRGACTSPTAASKSTRSLARTPGNCFVMPRILTAGTEGAPGPPAPLVDTSFRAAAANASALGAPDDALDEPVHRVQLLHRQALALRHPQLPLLVVERSRELVELAGDQLGPLLQDRPPRRRLHAPPERCDVREAVLDRPVVEGALPRPVHGRLHAPQVVRAPVVDRRRQPRL